MSLEDKAKATAKKVEGKVQEAVGNVTDSADDRNKGKAKQVEADVRNAAEDLKDKVQDVAETVQTRVEAAVKTVAGKVEELVGKHSDDPAKTIKGKATQAEADVLNAKEDLR